ncbi:divalent ion tolerance protein CutA [Ciceribacter naphthalenivorans]|uniref:Divalent ion tolerance protein CutA n=3 Tax=Alphaproteobacteria TaxID=28211 RepID=A0A512HCF8_9HYPH|nr:LTA synthase family protein [Sphingomonas psychrolutea]GEO83131.1 divalent ion tolerance protein CutA [Ciceribacter naphthalenivorans]GLR20474.1 divalent ion tolerance protein CutA [Ciceribacter naphthalenivorans]GLT03330.1 divalent ion tolerance protein CutA [Sphingomonas psychrolutea]
MAEIVSEPGMPVANSVLSQEGAAPRERTAALRAAGRMFNTLVLALVTVILTEWLARGTLSGIAEYLLSPTRPGMVAVLVLFLLFIAADSLFGRAHQSALILVPVALLPAFLSMQKQQYLSDPLYPSDMLFGRQIGELVPVMFAARPFASIGLVAGVLALLVLLGYLLVLGRRHLPALSPLSKLVRLVVALPLIGGFLSLMDPNSFSYIRDRLNIVPMMWDQQENYRHNGFLLAFAFNVPMANVQAPHGYGADAIADIAPERLPANFFAGRDADVIMVMSESLWDPTRLGNTTLSPDPMPTIRKNASGNMFSPEFGGMTANVEFEALTGFSNAFLPYGSIPYQQYVRRPLPSLATFFASKGYVTRAFHPFQSWFWNRANVYQSLGFQSFKSEENMPVMDKRGIFASDEALTKEIIRNADSTKEPFFFFAVTLQGHGPYERNRYAKNTIDVRSAALKSQSRDSLATYAQGVREADDSLKSLMDWAKKRRRETIIVLFGDHLPPLGTVYTEAGYMPDVVATRKASVSVMKQEHETPLVVWSSKRGVQKDLGSVSPSQLPYYIVRLAGYRHPFYTGVLGRLNERYAIIDRHQLIGRNDRPSPDWATSGAPIDPLIQDYRYLQHDQMFGEGFGTQRFFPEQLERVDTPAS